MSLVAADFLQSSDVEPESTMPHMFTITKHVSKDLQGTAKSHCKLVLVQPRWVHSPGLCSRLAGAHVRQASRSSSGFKPVQLGFAAKAFHLEAMHLESST